MDEIVKPPLDALIRARDEGGLIICNARIEVIDGRLRITPKRPEVQVIICDIWVKDVEWSTIKLPEEKK